MGELLVMVTIVVAVLVVTIPEAKPQNYCACHFSPSRGPHGLLCDEAPYTDKGLTVFLFLATVPRQHLREGSHCPHRTCHHIVMDFN